MKQLPFSLGRVRLALLSGVVLSCCGVSSAYASTSYCCADASGRRTCGDILPAVCYDRAYTVMSGGRAVREVEAPLTPEQRAKKDAELRAERDRAAREAEARRRDQVLLESYSSIAELDRRRDRDVGNIEGELRGARAREADLLAQQAALFKRKPASGNVPRDVAEGLVSAESELEAVRSVILSKQRDLDQLRARFDADHTRYLQLSGQGGGTSAASPQR